MNRNPRAAQILSGALALALALTVCPVALGDGECTAAGEEIIANPPVHAYSDEWIVDVEPTSTTEGLRHQECGGLCEHVYYQSIPATGSSSSIVKESISAAGSPVVMIESSSASLDVLLTDEERAAASTGNPARVWVEQIPFDPVVPPAQSSGSEQNPAPDTLTTANVPQAGSPQGEGGIGGEDETGDVGGEGESGDLDLDASTTEPDQELNEAGQAFSQLTAEMMGDYGTWYPFDITLYIQAPGCAAHAVSTLPNNMTLKLSLQTPTWVVIDGTDIVPEQVALLHYTGGRAVRVAGYPDSWSERQLFEVSSLSPFAIIWNTMAAASGGSVAPPSVSPSTPAAPQAPAEPESPVLEEPAPEADATASEPFIAWSPKQGRHRIVLRWTPVDGADGYLISASRCSTHRVKRTVRPFASVGPAACRWVDRGLDPGTWRKYVVQAFRLVDGRREFIASAKMVHASTLGGRSLAASGIELTGDGGIELSGCGQTMQLSLKTGDALQLQARELGKRLLVHHRGMRFATTDASVAFVDGTGTLRTVEAGCCRVWAYAQSGVYVMLEVNVEAANAG